MNCPDCGFKTIVRRTTSVTVNGAEIKTRVLTCDSGHRHESQEQITLALNATGTVQPTVQSTVRGSGSDPCPDLLPFLEADPDPSLIRDLGVDPPRAKPRKGRGDAVGYPSEFEELWSNCHGKKGNKQPAFKAWEQNKPPLTLTIERWALWMTTDQWQRGYSQHMSTWLNERGWEGEPDVTELPRMVSRATQRIADVGNNWIRMKDEEEARTNGKR